jgi:hypothetical protein
MLHSAVKQVSSFPEIALNGLSVAYRGQFVGGSPATGPVPPFWCGGALPARALPSARPWEVAPPSMAALKKKNGLASGPAPSLAQGPSTERWVG